MFVNSFKTLVFLTLLCSLNLLNADSGEVYLIDLSIPQMKNIWESKVNSDKILKYIYPEMFLISTGKWVRDVFDSNNWPKPDEKGIYDYYYRLVAISQEYNDYVILEKWSGFDEDCFNIKLTNQMTIPFDILFNFTYSGGEAGEHIIVKKIRWLSSTEFVINFNDGEYHFRIKE